MGLEKDLFLIRIDEKKEIGHNPISFHLLNVFKKIFYNVIFLKL